MILFTAVGRGAKRFLTCPNLEHVPKKLTDFLDKNML
jgi:hypothetical protein